MRKKDKLKKDDVQNAANALSSLSRKDSQEVTRKTAAGLLKAQVKAARARGATWGEIAEALKASGLDISVKTLARTLDEDGKGKAGNTDKTKTKKMAVAPVAAPTGAGAVPPPPPVAGAFNIKPDRGADL